MDRIDVRRLPDDWTADDEALLQSIDDATATPVYVSYKLAPEWFDGVLYVLDELEACLSTRPAIALALVEHTIARLDRAANGVDDSDGGMVEACTRLASLHAAAAHAAGLSDRDTAERARVLNELDLRPFELD